MDNSNDLSVILRSRVPLVVVESLDERRFVAMLKDIVRSASGGDYRPLFQWSITDGLQRLDIAMDPQAHNAEPGAVLRHIRAIEAPGIYVLLDFHPYFSDPVHVRLLKDIAVASSSGKRTIVLVSHELTLPPELERLSARFTMSLPNDNERSMIVHQVVERWNQENPGSVNVDPQALQLLINNLAGLTRADTERLAHNAIYADGAIAATDLPGVMQAKYELLSRDGVLSFEYETAQFSNVGGLKNLKIWLEQRKQAFAGEVENLDPPRGVMLIGVQGCGKSLAAKAAAGILGVPLLRLDFGSIYNKFHGESERNLRDSLGLAEVMSPCILWIDEMEKGLATGGGNDGLSSRILGTFLTWMSEKHRAVFVIATANDISQLPPELVRKGRFDEIFFVDLPDAPARANILHIHLRNRGYDPETFGLAKLMRASEGFSGAEIEQGIVSSLYAASATGRTLNTEHLLAEFERTRPLSIVMGEKISALRSWAAERTVPAD
jgi:SpoVK/Ycf46/Vps4 family AAA+-type ATPase